MRRTRSFLRIIIVPPLLWIGSGTVVLSWLAPGPSYAWGPATHAYIAHELGSEQGRADLQEVYGAVLPDAFNLMFGDPLQESLWTQTHYEFMKLVEKAESNGDKALAYGFASHNEAWGADRTAHISSTVHPESGYVIRKRDELAAILEPQVRFFLLLSGVFNAGALVKEVLPTVADSAIETAVDLLICENEDPQIGERLMLAARARGWSAPILLSKAYVEDLAATAGTTEAVAASLIIGAEKEFREQIGLYGAALTQEERIDALSEQGAELAKLLLAAEHGTIVDIPADLMTEILNEAIDVVKDDYAVELAATVEQVRLELESHDVATGAP